MRTPAASGYKSLALTPLGEGIVYAGTIVDRNFEDDMLYYITNSTVLDPLTRCGQTIQFNRPARVGPWRRYEKNQNMVADQPVSDAFCISICGASYKSIKIDKLDIYRACNEWEAFEASFLNDAWYNLSELWHADVLTGMQLQVSHRNLGKHAGRYGNIDLGTIGNALHLTPDNIIGFLSKLSDVLKDAGRWYEGEMFVVVPRAFQTLLLETMFAKQMCCNTGESVLFKGMKARDIMGFTVVESNRMRPVVDPATKRLVYPILAGWNEAYGFTGDIVEAELRDAPGNSFGVMYNMLTLYGGGVIYPEALAKAYVTFSTDGTVTRP